MYLTISSSWNQPDGCQFSGQLRFHAIAPFRTTRASSLHGIGTATGCRDAVAAPRLGSVHDVDWGDDL